MAHYSPTPLEELLTATVARRKVSIGLPKPQGADKRFPLTPEAAGMLVERGFAVKIETGGADSIHYGDFKYQELGATIVDRAEALRCDIVICLTPLALADARGLKRGSMLLTLFDSALLDPRVLAQLLASHVITIALDLIVDDRGHMPIADILS